MNAEIAARPHLIEATAPPERRGVERDAIPMLVTDRASRCQTHRRFFDLPSLLQPGDVLVVNDSATVPAALTATRPSGERLQLHVATRIDARIWMAEPRGQVTLGEELRLPLGGSAVAIAPVEPARPRLWYFWFALPQPMYAYLRVAGEPIRYRHVALRFPLEDYQTMFARVAGSSEMPSAARPFTPRVVGAIGRAGVTIATVTLHCGVSSFEAPERPGTEWFAVPHATAQIVNAARREGRRVVAVGTTVLRALESAVYDGTVVASSGWTDLVIDEKHAIRTADALLTGFHESSGTHVWIVGAFLDRELLESAYDAAAQHAYHYHEFGDVHLIV